MKPIIYLLQVSACSAIFYLFYYTLLRRLTFFTINRWYLLGTLMLSFIIPAMHLPVQTDNAAAMIQPVMQFNQLQHFTEPVKQIKISPADEAAGLNWALMLKCIYSLIAIASLTKLVVMLMSFLRRSHGQRLFKIGSTKVIRATDGSNSSFFNVVFVDDSCLSPQDLQQVIAHELLHIRLAHSADRLFARIVLAVLWFNPFAYFYIRSMEENHEFEVDRIATGCSDKGEYAALLFKLSVAGNDYLMHSFSKVPLKSRIAMLFNKPTSNMKKTIYMLLLPLVAISCLAFANLKINNQQTSDFYTTVDFKDKNGVELVKRTVHIPGSKGTMGEENLKGTSVVFIVNGKAYKEADAKIVEDEVKKLRLTSWSAGSVKDYPGTKDKSMEQYDTFFDFKGSTNLFGQLLDTVKTKYRQKIKRTEAQKLAEQRATAEFKAYLKTDESKYKWSVAERVHHKLLNYEVVDTVSIRSKAMRLSGYKLRQDNDEFLLRYDYGQVKSIKGLFKPGDQIQVNARGGMWGEGIPVVIDPTEIRKGDETIFRSVESLPTPKEAFLYEANKVRFAKGQVTNIKKYANGKWKSAVVEIVNGYKIKFNIKPNAPEFKDIEWGDHVTFRFVHEVKTGAKEYTVNDWVALSNQEKDYGVRNPEYFYKFYEKI